MNRAEPNWTIDEAVLAEYRLVPDIREQIQQQIIEKLSQGVPVTLTCDGKRLATYYPDGTSENHDWR